MFKFILNDQLHIVTSICVNVISLFSGFPFLNSDISLLFSAFVYTRPLLFLSFMFSKAQSLKADLHNVSDYFNEKERQEEKIVVVLF